MSERQAAIELTSGRRSDNNWAPRRLIGARPPMAQVETVAFRRLLELSVLYGGQAAAKEREQVSFDVGFARERPACRGERARPDSRSAPVTSVS